MLALRYRGSIPDYLTAKATTRLLPSALASGRIPGLELVRIQPPRLPGSEWLRLRPLLCGICGSDLSVLTARASPALSPFASFPAVLGHEIVAEVAEVGPGVEGFAPGERVVVDPVISCQVRGLEPCAPCERGQGSLCTRSADPPLAPGFAIGYCRDLPGGWSESMLAHRTQVYRVPPSLPDPLAVLVEPLSVALHAVLKLPPRAGSRVLIVGGGTLGLCVLAALRLLALRCQVTVVARYPFQRHLAEKFGADVVMQEGEGSGQGAGGAAVQVAGARAYRPVIGRPVYAGGFDWVYDCVGSSRSLDESLRVAGPGGHLVLVGCAGEIANLDWTFVWARELHVLGSYVYARETSQPGQPHTFEIALRLLAEHPDLPLAELVTHRFSLLNWRQALGVCLGRKGHGAIKTVFECASE